MDKQRRIRVAIGTPMIDGIHGGVYGSHLSLAIDVGRSCDAFVMPSVGLMPHCKAREKIITEAINYGCDYLLFVDSDVAPPDGAFDQLMEAMMSDPEVRMTSGACPRRGYPYTTTWFRKIDGVLRWLEPPNENTIELDSCGLPLNLIDLKWVREHLNRPYFVQGYAIEVVNEDELLVGDYLWEDAWFCSQIRKKGGKILGVGAVQCGHLGNREMIEKKEANDLRKRHLLKTLAGDDGEGSESSEGGLYGGCELNIQAGTRNSA